VPDEGVDDEGLFEVEGFRVVPAASESGRVVKTFRAFNPDQELLLPPSLDEWLPADHLARFVADLVDEHVDLSRIHAAYQTSRGGPPYDPRLMVRLLVYGYTTGVRSSRAIERACTDIVAFRWLAAGQVPDYRAIARFRRRHLAALGNVFLQALALCQAAGMVKLGRVALDGTKVRANASKRKAMSYARLTDKEKVLAEEVSALLAAAEDTDRDEDDRFGKDRRGDELPDELARRESRLAALRAAKALLEAEAKAAAAAKATARAREKGLGEDAVAEAAARAGAEAVPAPKAQRNFTDPESRIMLTGDGSFAQCYNAQAVVDDAHQVIIATQVSQCAADVNTLIPMVKAATVNTGQAPAQVLADAGYCSAANLDAAADLGATTGTEFFIATGRTRHGEPAPLAPRGRIPASATPKQRMAGKLTTKRGRAVYARRKVIVEPVFGQIATLQGKRFLLRGLDGAQGEWSLIAACHNLRKLYQVIGVGGLATLQTA